MTLPADGTGLPELVFQAAADFPADEALRAREYWASRGVDRFYLDQTHWARHIADRVLELGPTSVLEFGSNCGRNLVAIHELDPHIRIAGVDVNPDAVALGRERGLDLRIGDEHLLHTIGDDCYDVTFTVSVLDHLPDPRHALAELIRIARTGTMLLEPWIGQEGKVVRAPNRDSGVLENIEPYAYSWDYVHMVSDLAPDRTVSVSPYDLGPGGMRRWWSAGYRVITIC